METKFTRRAATLFAVLVGIMPSCTVPEADARKKKRKKAKTVASNPPPKGPTDAVILIDEETGRQMSLGGEAEVGAEGFGQQRWYRNLIPLNDWTSAGIGDKVAKAADNWNYAAGGGITFLYNRMPHTENCEGVEFVHGEVVVCNQLSNKISGIEGCSGFTGCTQLRGHRVANGYWEISAAKVTLAAARCDTNSEESGYWWHCLAGHELGHVFGLEHPVDWNEHVTGMGTQRLNPGTRDAQELFKEYGGNGGYVVPGPTPVCCGEFLLARDNSVRVKPRKKVKRQRGRLHPQRGNHTYKRRPGGIWPPPEFLSKL